MKPHTVQHIQQRLFLELILAAAIVAGCPVLAFMTTDWARGRVAQSESLQRAVEKISDTEMNFVKELPQR